MHLRHSSKLLLLLLIKVLCLTSFQMSYAEESRADDVLYAELRANWNDIFPSGNRNAGGAMFFKYIYDNYKDYNEFLSMNRFYCQYRARSYHLTQNQNLFMQTTSKPENQPVEAFFAAVGHVHAI